jgi:hypothetical protein
MENTFVKKKMNVFQTKLTSTATVKRIKKTVLPILQRKKHA